MLHKLKKIIKQNKIFSDELYGENSGEMMAGERKGNKPTKAFVSVLTKVK